MDYTNISKIKGLVSLATHRKSTHIPDGDFLSPFHGQSLEFDELGEYHYGDNIRHIDWKASSAHGKTLVRRYIAGRRHKVLLIGDCGRKMSGHTSAKEKKSELAETVLGAFAWLFSDKGCDYTLLSSRSGKIGHEPFHCGNEHLVRMLDTYEKNAEDKRAVPLNDLLRYAVQNYKGEMFVILVTDLEGLSTLDEYTVRMLSFRKDIMVICIDDIPLSGAGTFDVYNDRYSDTFMIGGKRLHQAEMELRKKIYTEKHDLLVKNRASLEMISKENDIIDCILSLFRQNNRRMLNVR